MPSSFAWTLLGAAVAAGLVTRSKGIWWGVGAGLAAGWLVDRVMHEEGAVFFESPSDADPAVTAGIAGTRDVTLGTPMRVPVGSRLGVV